MTTRNTQTVLGELMEHMTEESVESSGLDAKTLMQVRIAALIASSAPPASYLMNVGKAVDLGLSDDDVRSVLVAVAPIVGTARTADAVTAMVKALGFALSLDGSTPT